MALTVRELNRATLARQLLLERTVDPVTEVVRRILAVQAQEPASPYVALWNRIAAFEPAELDAAFADGEVLKATLMRVTLHAVTAEDHPDLRAALLPTLRTSRLNAARFRGSGLSAEDADQLARELTVFAARPRTRPEIEAFLADRLGTEPDPGVWWALRSSAPLVHEPTGGPWAFGPRPVFRAAPSSPRTSDGAASVRHLVVRYLAAFGPASIQDLARFAMLPQSTLRTAVAAVAAVGAGLVELEGPGGTALLDLPDAPRPDGDVAAPPRLLPMWDSVLLAHADRTRVLPEAYRAAVIRRNGDVLPTLLVDGQVRGVWRAVDGAIEATAFEPLPDAAWAGLDGEARALSTLVAGRDPAVYRRYRSWWRDLPAVQVERLG